MVSCFLQETVNVFELSKSRLKFGLRRRMVDGGRSLLPEILGHPAPIGAKSPILNRYSLVVPQP